MSVISLDQLTVMGVTPGEMVSIAAELGYDALGPIASADKSFDLGVYTLARNTPHTLDMIARMKDTGVTINNLDGFVLKPDTDVTDYREKLELAAELGAQRVVTLSFDPDADRAFERFCRLAEETRAVGLGLVLEFTPISCIRSLEDAASWVKRSGQSNARILIDALHLMKSGGTPADIAKVDPKLIASAQICDGPAHPTDEQYAYACLWERQIPGEGQLPLVEFLAALPPHVTVGVEVPLKSLADQGVPPKERARRCIVAVRRLMAQTGRIH